MVAPTQQALRNRGAASIENVSANVAGFSVQNLGPGQSQIAMRGVSAGQIVRDQPGVKEQVGVYLDESVISLSLFTPDRGRVELASMVETDVVDGGAASRARPQEGTMIGKGVVIEGEMSGSEDLAIEGKVDGTVSFREHVVTVGPRGRVQARVVAKSVVVFGVVNGMITASEKVSIEASGRVEGVVTAPRVAIADGAQLQGRVDMARRSAGSPAVPAVR